MELTEAHFFVLSVADGYEPGPEILDLLVGVHRRITLELFDDGGLEVTLAEDTGGRLLVPDEARAVLADPHTWVNRVGSRATICELSLTEQGRELFDRTREIFGDEIERRYEAANEANAEFEREEPEFWQQHTQWFEDWRSWIDSGFEGPRPEHPPWPEPPVGRASSP